MAPESWRREKLGSLATAFSGGTPPRAESCYFGGDIPWVKSGEVNARRVRETEETITQEGFDNSSAKWVLPGSVLVAMYGATAGKVARLEVKAAINQAILAVTAMPDIASNDYLLYVLDAAAPELLRRAQGSGQPNLSAGLIKNLEILVPSLPEQRKIAAILSSVDGVIEKTEGVIEHLQAVKKVMMQELLTRGVPGRHTRFKQTEIGEIPEDWEVVRAADVCALITKGATPKEQTQDAGEVRFLKVYNIDPGGFIDLDYRPSFIPRSVHEGALKRSRILPKDVLMNIVGPPLGKIAVVPAAWADANINQAIAVFRPSNIESEYLATCLSAPHLFSWAATRAKRTSTQLNLTLELCRDYPMPLPKPEERQVIVGILNSALMRLNAETCSLQSLRATRSALMSVLLTGELRVTSEEDAA